MGRPKKDPSLKMVRVNLTLRPQDLNALRRLSVEIFSRELTSVGGLGAGGTPYDILSVERPGLSSAIRYLIDAEFKRRAGIAFQAWKDLPSDKRPEDPLLEDLLRFDDVFGAHGAQHPKTPEARAFQDAYTSRLLKSLRSQETLTREAERSLNRGESPLVQLMASLQSTRPKPKGKRR